MARCHTLAARGIVYTACQTPLKGNQVVFPCKYCLGPFKQLSRPNRVLQYALSKTSSATDELNIFSRYLLLYLVKATVRWCDGYVESSKIF